MERGVKKEEREKEGRIGRQERNRERMKRQEKRKGGEERTELKE